jgi:hypothetical protein
MTESPEQKSSRRVVCAAIRIGDLIVAGVRHFDMVMHGQLKLMPSLADGEGYVSAVHEAKQGFIDQRGVFMDREEALAVAEAAGQLHGEKCHPKYWLFSEDLY